MARVDITDQEWSLIQKRMVNPGNLKRENYGVIDQVLANNDITSYKSALSKRILKDFHGNMTQGRGSRGVPLHLFHTTDKMIPFGRSFDAKLVETQRKTKFGEPLIELVGKFYVPLSGKVVIPAGGGWIDQPVAEITYEDLNARYDEGALPAGSVGFSYNTAMCSICQTSMFAKDPCEHAPGKKYDGKICYVVLGEEQNGQGGGNLREYSLVEQGAIEDAGPSRSYNFNNDDRTMRLVFPEFQDSAVLEEMEQTMTTPNVTIPDSFVTEFSDLKAKVAVADLNVKNLTADVTRLNEENTRLQEVEKEFSKAKPQLEEFTKAQKALRESVTKLHVQTYGATPEADLEKIYGELSMGELVTKSAELNAKFVELFGSSRKSDEDGQETQPSEFEYSQNVAEYV